MSAIAAWPVAALAQSTQRATLAELIQSLSGSPVTQVGDSFSPLAAPQVPSGVAVGRTAGSFAVSSTGGANYSIPIWTPPGISGLSPSLALVYSSASGDGEYGVGWSITGLSSISRCPRTYGADGYDANVWLTSTDAFCIDGKKLRSFSGTYGADGSQYQTELADFSLIISHGTVVSPGVGPAWFEVYGKNGLIYEYGNANAEQPPTHAALLASGSTTVLTWALNKIRDRSGNHIDIDYTNDTTNHELRPNTITYTTPPAGSGAQSTPNYQVAFSFAQRTSAIPVGFTGNTQFLEPFLAQTISINAWNGSAYAAVRTYNLSYTPGPTTGRSQFTSIQECSPTQCFPATAVTYQSGSSGWGSAVTSSGVVPLGATPLDLNGDGFEDLVYPDAASGHYKYLLGTATGTYQGPYDTGVTSTGYQQILPIDYNGDGKMEVLLVPSSGAYAVMSFTTSGGTFSKTTTTVTLPSGYVGTQTGDVDGDGREDIVIYVSGGTAWTASDHIYANLSTGSGFGATQTLYSYPNGTGCAPCVKLLSPPIAAQKFLYNSHIRRPDFNGDGRVDLMYSTEMCADSTSEYQCGTAQNPLVYGWEILASSGSGISYYEMYIDQFNSTQLGQGLGIPPLVGDFNGDGCADVAYNVNSQWVIRYGTCFVGGAALSAPVLTGATDYAVFPLAIDWDGDGRDDIVEPNSTTGSWGVAHSTGTNLTAWSSLGRAYTNLSTTLLTDANGDGLFDIVSLPPNPGGAPALWPHNGTGVQADLATSFVDGFGVTYSPIYGQITNSSYYLKGTGAAFPEIDDQTPRNVVTSYTASDGIGGTYSISKFYATARVNVQRQQFEGYGSVRSIDSRTGFYGYSYFGQLFPLTGMLARQSVYQANGTTFVSDVQNTLLSSTLDATNRRYFPYVSQSVVSVYEVNGALNGSLITQRTTAIAYAGTNGFTYGNPSQITTTTVDKDSTSPWYTNTFTDLISITPHEDHSAPPTGWCIGLTDQTTGKRTQPSGTNLTHTQSFTVSSDGTCRVTAQTIEPSSSTDKVATSYGFTDGCGNVNTISITGQNPDGTSMNPRTTTIGYGTRCIAPESVTKPLDPATTIGYRYDLGLQTSITDPNGLAASTTYNDLGQKTLDQRPDGTQTSFSYSGCSSPPCWGDGNLRYNVQRNELDSTGGHSSYWSTTQFFDQFGRLKYDEPVQSNGVAITRLVSYDNRGRVVGRTNPYGNGFSSYTTTMVYDAVNRVTQEYRPISSTNPTLEYTTYTYQGRTQTVTDPRNYVTKKQFDVLGELLLLTDPDRTSQTNYSYGPFGNLASITDPSSNVTSRSYDALGYQLTGSSDPDRGSWVYQYDSLGELVKLRDANTSSPNWTQQLTYDALGRPLTRVETEGTTTWTWGTVAANHEIGQLVQLSGLGDTESYTFDASGRPASHTETWNSTAYAISYAYNTLGKLDTLTYPSTPLSGNRFQVKYGYTNGYLSSLQNYTGGTAGTTFWKLTSGTVNMDPWGHVVDETLGTTTAVRIQSAFDAVTSWIGTRQVGSGGSSNNLQSLSYSWDVNGNLSERKDLKQSLTEDFVYDNLNRLQSSTLNGTANYAVTFDPTGNITSVTDPAVYSGGAKSYTYDPVHKHAVSSVNLVSYSYDANGNMSRRGGYPITWSSANLPTSMQAIGGSTTSFSYGPDRQRKQQTSYYVSGDGDNGQETTIYVGAIFEVETTPAQTHYKHFVQVPGGTQIIYDLQSVSGTQVTYITADHLGSGNLFLNSTGSAVINESYSAFGYRRSSNWSGQLASGSGDYTTIASTTRRGYTDAFHEMLDNVGLIHMNGRVYDPVIGRFLSADPVVAQVGNSQSGNSYSYVQNRPLSLMDPTGLAPRCGRGDGCNPALENGREWASYAPQLPGLLNSIFNSMSSGGSDMGFGEEVGGGSAMWNLTGMGSFQAAHMSGFTGASGAVIPQTTAAFNAADLRLWTNAVLAGNAAAAPSGADSLPEVVVNVSRSGSGGWTDWISQGQIVPGPNPSPDLRFPDYVQFDFGAWIFGFSGTFSRSGNSFFGGSFARTYPANNLTPTPRGKTGVSVSIVGGWLNQLDTPSGDRVDNFLEGLTYTAAGFAVVGGGEVYSPALNTSATVLGLGGGISVGAGVNQLQGSTGLGDWTH